MITIIITLWLLSGLPALGYIIKKYAGKPPEEFIADGSLNLPWFVFVCTLALPDALLIMPILYVKKWILGGKK